MVCRFLNPENFHKPPLKSRKVAKLPLSRPLMPDLFPTSETFVSTLELAIEVAREVKAEKLRKIGSRLYTRNMTDPPELIVQRNLWPLVGAYMPGALIADRTALENRPAADGSVFLISDHKRDIVFPGVTLRPRKGSAPLDSDRPFLGGLRLSSPARAYLENMKHSRARSSVARTLSASEIEQRLEEMLRISGEAALQRLRDDARAIAQLLDLPNEFRRLDNLIGALLGTRDERLVTSPGIARAAGRPYDPHRLDLFQRLFAELSAGAPVTRLAKPNDGPALPFFEAYFSNFIEGTEFAVDEAADIVFRSHIPAGRTADGHDVLGTYRIVCDQREMSRLPRNFEELAMLLKSRHASIMEGRPDKGPGCFKTEPNRAGSTLFVAPELVEGTLAQGYEIYRGLASPLDRAIFMMFLISEVHPFADGNGRVSRVMMNADLVAAGECRIIVPTVYRNNFLSSLKALSLNGITGAIARTLDFAQRYTLAIDFTDVETAHDMLVRTHAFVDANEADAAGIRLKLPTPEMLAS